MLLFVLYCWYLLYLNVATYVIHLLLEHIGKCRSSMLYANYNMTFKTHHYCKICHYYLKDKNRIISMIYTYRCLKYFSSFSSVVVCSVGWRVCNFLGSLDHSSVYKNIILIVCKLCWHETHKMLLHCTIE